MNFVSTEQVKNTNISTNYNISAISGGAADGRDPADSFDISEGIFLIKKFSGFLHMHSPVNSPVNSPCFTAHTSKSFVHSVDCPSRAPAA